MALSGTKAALTTAKSTLEVFNPVPGLTLVPDALLVLINRVEEMRTTQEGLEELSNKVLQLVNVINGAMENVKARMDQYLPNDPRYHGLEERLRGSELSSRIDKLCDMLNSLKAQADELYKGPFCLRCFHSSQDAETLKKLQSGVADVIEHFKLQCQVAIEGLISEVLQKVENGFKKIENDREAEKGDKCLEALPHVEANYRAYVNAPKSSFLKGTRSKLLEDLQTWAEGRAPADPDLSNKPIYLIIGDVGTGKSTIASEFAKRLDTTPLNAYGASFFFDRGVEALSSAKFFFTTIAYELAHVQGAFRQPVINAAREYLKRGKHQQMKYTGDLAQKAISEVGSEHPAVLLVVDGVDECTDLVPELLNILTRCVDVSKAPFQLRVLVTSRLDLNSKDFLSRYPAHVQRVSLDDPSSKYGTDEILAFLHYRFSQTTPGKRVLDSESQHKRVERLASRANRSFLFARTAMDILDNDLDHFEETLQKLLDPAADSAVVQPTVRSHQGIARDPLDGLYLTILETVFPSGDVEDENTLPAHVEAVLACIALLSDHLSPCDLEAFMAISPERSLSVLHKLRAVVVSDDDKPAERVFRPMHGSFPQFLVDPARCTNPRYIVNKSREHARLAERCLNAVMSLRRNVVELENAAVPLAEVENLSERVKEHVLPHVRYACLHWASHIVGAEKTPELKTALGKFAIPQRIQTWLETLGYLGRLDIAQTALASAYNWQEGGNLTRELLDKARRMVDGHYREIEDCPGAVYQFEIKRDASSGQRGPPPPVIGIID